MELVNPGYGDTKTNDALYQTEESTANKNQPQVRRNDEQQRIVLSPPPRKPSSKNIVIENNFYTATLKEALSLREKIPHTKDICLFNGFTAAQLPLLIAENVTPIITSLDQLKLWQETGRTYMLHFDTGMNRLSISSNEYEKVIDTANQAQVISVMSHLACPDLPEHPMNRQQLNKFQQVGAHFPSARKSLAASKGITFNVFSNNPIIFFFYSLLLKVQLKNVCLF